jgi:hypothetical protein
LKPIQAFDRGNGAVGVDRPIAVYDSAFLKNHLASEITKWAGIVKAYKVSH